MFVCEKFWACIGCNYQYADRLDQIDEEFRDCERLIEVEEVKHAHWNIHTDEDGIYGICSNCHRGTDFSHYGKAYPICPHCGAKIDEVVNNEENV